MVSPITDPFTSRSNGKRKKFRNGSRWEPSTMKTKTVKPKEAIEKTNCQSTAVFDFNNKIEEQPNGFRDNGMLESIIENVSMEPEKTAKSTAQQSIRQLAAVESNGIADLGDAADHPKKLPSENIVAATGK